MAHRHGRHRLLAARHLVVLCAPPLSHLCGVSSAPCLPLLTPRLAAPRRAAHKGKAKLHAIQKERRQRKREALESGAAPDWGGEGSDSDKSEDWDIEKVLGEKVPIPRWAREDAERAAAAAGATAGAEGAATGRGTNTNRSGGHTGRETARSGAGAQTARTAGTGATGRVAQGGGTATVGAGSTRRDSILSEVTGR